MRAGRVAHDVHLEIHRHVARAQQQHAPARAVLLALRRVAVADDGRGLRHAGGGLPALAHPQGARLGGPCVADGQRHPLGHVAVAAGHQAVRRAADRRLQLPLLHIQEVLHPRIQGAGGAAAGGDDGQGLGEARAQVRRGLEAQDAARPVRQQGIHDALGREDGVVRRDARTVLADDAGGRVLGGHAHGLGLRGSARIAHHAPPVVKPPRRGHMRGMDLDFSEDELHRYSRHILLREVGAVGQARLRAARVLLVGAGGLGSPLALYLAAAGVGTLGLLDDDALELSNLQRQVAHATARIGQPKVDSAAQSLRALNPSVTLELHHRRLDADAAEFAEFVRQLRRAKDQEEFDRFMAGRGQAGGPAGGPTPGSV